MKYNGVMVGIDIRTWTWRVAVVGVVGFIIFSTLQSRGPSAIRPESGQIKDVLLLKAITQYADEVDAKRKNPTARMHLGMTYEAALLYELAENTYQQFVDQYPHRVVGWYRLAIVQERQGELEKAIPTLRKAAEIAGTNMDVPHWQLGLWLIDVGRLEEAKQSIQMASSINPNSVPVQIATARIAIEENKPKVAISILSNPTLIEQVPDGYVYQLLGRAYRANGEVEKAREAWSLAGESGNDRNDHRYIDLLSANVESHGVGLRDMRQKITRHVDNRQFLDARKLIQTYYTLDAGNRVVRRLDAMCDLKQGYLDKSFEKFTLLVEEDPLDTRSMIFLAVARMQSPKYRIPIELTETKKLIDSILAINPTNARSHYLLGEVYLMESNPRKAIACYEESLRLDQSLKEPLRRAMQVIAKLDAWETYDELVQKGLVEMPDHPALRQFRRGEE